MQTIRTYLTMLWKSFSSFAYYQNLRALTPKSIIIFYLLSFFLFNFIFSAISFVQIRSNPEIQVNFINYANSIINSFSLVANPEASLSSNLSLPTAANTATLTANLVATASTFSTLPATSSTPAAISADLILNNLPLIFLLIIPLAAVIFTLPSLLLEIIIIYFLGRFEKRGLTVWTAAAFSVHTTLITQLLNQIIVSIYQNPIPDILYLLHWIFIIVIVYKFYPIKKDVAAKK